MSTIFIQAVRSPLFSIYKWGSRGKKYFVRSPCTTVYSFLKGGHVQHYEVEKKQMPVFEKRDGHFDVNAWETLNSYSMQKELENNLPSYS